MNAFFLVVLFMLFVPMSAFADSVPEWVKTTSSWWSDGLVGDDEFLNSMTYLIEHNILIVSYDGYDYDDLLLNAAITENNWKTNHLVSLLDFRNDSIILLADTSEFQALVTFSEYNFASISDLDKVLVDGVSSRFIDFAEQDDSIDQLRVLDKTGMEIIRLDKVHDAFIPVLNSQLQDKSDRYYFHESLKLTAGEIYVSHIDLNIEHGEIEIPYKPTLRISTPIHDSNDVVLGILLINYDMKSILDSYLPSSFCNVSVFDETGIIILDSDETKLFGDQLGTNVNYFETDPRFKIEDDKESSWYFNEVTEKTIILNETESDDHDRHWHFVCELK